LKESIEQFLNCKNIAIVGMSSKTAKFGNLAYKELSNKDYNVFPIHPKSKKIDDSKCYNTFESISDEIEGVLISVHPEETEKVVVAAHQNGIKNIWMQQGAQSDNAIQYCNESNLNVVHDQCILMYANPVKGIHKAHKWFWKILRRLPK